MQIGKAAVLVLILFISISSLNNGFAQNKEKKVTAETKCDKPCEAKAKSEIKDAKTCSEDNSGAACAKVKTAGTGTEANTTETCTKETSNSNEKMAGCCAKKTECAKRAECEKKCDQKQKSESSERNTDS